MKLNRAGEQGTIPQRNDRFFKTGDYWYYTTREGVDIGPFDSLAEADQGVSEFIEFIECAEPSIIEMLEHYGNHAVA